MSRFSLPSLIRSLAAIAATITPFDMLAMPLAELRQRYISAYYAQAGYAAALLMLMPPARMRLRAPGY